MPRRTANSHLEEAMALLINNQAQFLSTWLSTVSRMEGEFSEIKSILLRHEQILLRHEEILLRHQQMLEALPEAVRQKIGFQPQ